MNRYEWSNWTDPEAVRRRAGGRRRYNAERRRRAEARREALAEIVGHWLLPPRGAVTALAGHFGVSPSTISRDLRLVLWGGQEYDFSGPDGELLFTVTRAYAGGPVLSITGPDGNEIRGAARHDVLRHLRQRFGR